MKKVHIIILVNVIVILVGISLLAGYLFKQQQDKQIAEQLQNLPTNPPPQQQQQEDQTESTTEQALEDAMMQDLSEPTPAPLPESASDIDQELEYIDEILGDDPTAEFDESDLNLIEEETPVP